MAIRLAFTWPVLGAAVIIASSARAQSDAPSEASESTAPPTPPQSAGADSGLEDGYIQRLIEAIKEDNSFKVRLQAVVFLSRTGDPRAAEPLLDVLATDSHYAVRAAAATALAHLGEPRAISHILRAVATDPEAFVRDESRRALGKYPRKQALPYIVAAFGSEDPSVRREVVTYLTQEPGSETSSVLIRALGDTAEIFSATKTVVMGMEPKARLRFLEEATEHRDPRVRRGAVQLLGETASKEATQIILSVYERDIEVDAVRAETRAALRDLRTFLNVERVVEDAASSPDKHSRAKALKLLGVIGGAEAEKALLEALKDEDIYLRGTAVMAMRELGDPSLVPSLERLVNDPANQRIAHLVKHTLKQLKKRQSGK